MGLLDFSSTPEGMQGLALLAAAGPSMQPMNLASRMALAGDTYRGLLGDQLKSKYLQAQTDNLASEADTRKAALQLALTKRTALPGLFGGATPAAQGQLGSGTFGVMPTAPGQDAIPSPTAAPAFNWRAALDAGYSPEEIQKLDGLRNVGLNKVARTVKATGPDGKEYEYQMDDFGRPVGAPMAQYRAPIAFDQGGQQAYLDPYTLQPVQTFKKSQSPDSAASVGATLRGQDMTDARAREQIQLGKVPAGYRQTATGGLEFIPGGPADPNAAKRAAPTEFQGKSATFGARAQEADKIISGLAGNYSPAGVNTKNSLESVPLFGSALGPMANFALSENSQKAEQAQRDFVNAVLRQESGAAINKDEFDNARKQYFPQPGDSEAVIAQKARNRQLAISGFRENARPGAVDEVVNGGQTPAPKAGPLSVKADWKYVNGRLVKAQ